ARRRRGRGDRNAGGDRGVQGFPHRAVSQGATALIQFVCRLRHFAPVSLVFNSANQFSSIWNCSIPDPAPALAVSSIKNLWPSPVTAYWPRTGLPSIGV